MKASTQLSCHIHWDIPQISEHLSRSQGPLLNLVNIKLILPAEGKELPEAHSPTKHRQGEMPPPEVSGPEHWSPWAHWETSYAAQGFTVTWGCQIPGSSHITKWKNQDNTVLLSGLWWAHNFPNVSLLKMILFQKSPCTDCQKPFTTKNSSDMDLWMAETESIKTHSWHQGCYEIKLSSGIALDLKYLRPEN